MAALFYITSPEVNYTKTWHIGAKPNLSKEEIENLEKVEIDGDEAQFLYGFGIKFDHPRVHTLKGNEAKMYVIIALCLYGENSTYEDTEGKINTYLKGDSNPKLN